MEILITVNVYWLFAIYVNYWSKYWHIFFFKANVFYLKHKMQELHISGFLKHAHIFFYFRYLQTMWWGIMSAACSGKGQGKKFLCPILITLLKAFFFFLLLTITSWSKNYYCPHFIVEETKTSEIKYNYLMSHHIQIWNVQLKSLYFFTKISPRKAHWNTST